MLTITLPWPDGRLSGNREKSVHWAIKRRITNDANMLAFTETRNAVNSSMLIPERLMLVIYFHPPHKRKYDADNWHIACKPYIDGMCRALGIDDSKIRVSVEVIGERVKGGSVILQLRSSDGVSEFLGLVP